MKRGAKLLTLVMVLALLVGGYFYSAFLNKQSAEGNTISTLKPDDIASITVDYDGEELSFEKREGTWYYSDPDFPLDQDKMAEMIAAFSKIEVVRTVSQKGEPKPEYGLSEPSVRVICTTAGGDSVSLRVGAKNTSNNQFYFMVDGSEAIYMIRRALPETFSRTLLELARLPGSVAYLNENVSSIMVEKGGEGAKLIQLLEGSDRVYSNYYKWFTEQGGDLVPLSNNAANLLVSSASQPDFTSCVAYRPTEEQLAGFGLKSPRAKVTLNYSEREKVNAADGSSQMAMVEKTATLLLGDAADDGESVYAMTGDEELVLLMKADKANPFIEFELKSFLPKDVCKIELGTVDKLIMSADGENYNVDIARNISTDAGGKAVTSASYSINGKAVDTEAFERLYRSITSMTAEGEAEGKVTDRAQVSITFIRNTTSFREMTLDFIPYGNSFHLVDFNGEQRLLVNKRKVQELAAALKELA